MPTNTTNYSFKKPVVGADEDLWGGYINDNFDSLDSLLSGTTALTALDVSGTVTADGLTVDGATTLTGDFNVEGDADYGVEFRGTVNTVDSIKLQSRFRDDTNGAYYGGANIEFIRDGNWQSSMTFDTAPDYAGRNGLPRMNIAKNGDISFYEDTGTTAKFFWDASAESLGIGTSSPQAKLHVSNGSAGFEFAPDGISNGTSYMQAYDRVAGTYDNVRWYAGEHYFHIGNDERMRIDASGNILMGKTAANFGNSTAEDGFLFQASNKSFHIQSNSATPFAVNRRSTTGSLINFYYNTGLKGSISTNGSSISYNTSSDYRLKEDVQPMTGASDRVLALKPVNFAWKADGTRVDGFLAHEAQEVVPEAVHGVKDGMRTEEYEVTPAVYEDVIIPAVLDADGNEVEPERTEQRLVSEAVMGTREVPDYQGIDQSKLVPLLTAALQEALGEIESLKARLDAIGA